MVVATLYKLLMEDGVFKKENKKVLREKFVVPKDTVEKYNSQYKNCGKFYEVHEKETEEYYLECEMRNEELEEAEKAQGQLKEVLVDLAKSNTKPRKKTAAKKDDSGESE